MTRGRRSIRLQDYNYSSTGAYYVTLCTFGRQTMFGEVVNDEMHLNDHGKIVKECWMSLTSHYSNVELDEFAVMPIHLHGIVFIVEDDNTE